MVICEKGYVSIDEHVPHPVEDESLIILGETDIGDEASIRRKLLKAIGDYHDRRLGVTKGEPRMTFYIPKLEEHVSHPIENEPLINIDETDIGDEAYESVGSIPRKLLKASGDYHDRRLGVTKGEPRMYFDTFEIEEIPEFGGGGRTILATDHEGPPEPKRPWDEVHYLSFEKINSSPPRGVVYLEAQEATAANRVGGFHGYEHLPGPPDIGTGNYAGTLGMQGGLIILMFAVCYMLYMILKKRVCSFHIGWKDNDGAAELELGGPREA